MLAERISALVNIPHIHLDRFWFEAGGAQVTAFTPESERDRIRAYIREKVQEAVLAESWVSDGLYSRMQSVIADRADTVIFLDVPLWRRLLNHAERMCRPTERHQELTLWHEVGFFFEMIRRTYTFQPKIDRVLATYKDKIVTLRSRKEIDAYVAKLKSERT